MKEYTRRQFVKQSLALSVGAAARGASSQRPGADLRLWYREPARKWVEALPVGNGRLGAMIFGGSGEERLQLNEESVWDGFARDRHNPRALEALPQVRRLLFNDRNEEATRLAAETMLGVPPTIDSYQPLGDLRLVFESAGEVGEYRRELDLETGIARIELQRGEVRFAREVFATAADQLIVARFTADQPGSISFSASLEREGNALSSVSAPRDLMLRGQCGEKGVTFTARARFIITGGSLRHSAGRMIVKRADRVLILIAGATSYGGGNPDEICERTVSAASRRSFAILRRAHINEYSKLFQRVTLDLGRTEAALLPTDERLRALARGTDDPHLFTLAFQYYRYLLISASRPHCLPSNLQGIWNEKMKAPWNSDYHPNINLQMNYWPAEVTNLAECHLPLMDWMERVAVRGSETARLHYGCRGWVLHHVSDIFHCTTPMDGVWGIWPMGGAWLCRHAWDHYSFGRDRDFLIRRAWPLMKGAARFLLDFLVTAPPETPVAGKLVTNPSHSPENSFRRRDGAVSQFTYGATMDLEIIRDLFTNCLRALDEMASVAPDAAFRIELEAALKRLAPLQISPRTGRLQEWIEDYEEPEPGHRHISHLYAFFPAEEITLRGTPRLAAAVRASLEHRLASGYEATGWSLGWIAALYARFGAGARAHAALSQLLAQKMFPNLFVNAHNQPQVGDGGGIPAALAEMLLQSHADEIELLPALPPVWSQGSVRGLRARGGYEVGIVWRNGALSEATIRSARENRCRVRAPLPLRIFCEGRRIDLIRTGTGTVEFTTAAGKTYQLRAAAGMSS